MSYCLCRAYVSSLSEHVSPGSPGVPLAGSGSFAPVVCSSSNLAARVGHRLSVLTQGSKGGTVYPLCHNFKGWCSSCCFANLALVLRRFTVMGTSVFIVGAGVGASLGVPAFKRA